MRHLPAEAQRVGCDRSRRAHTPGESLGLGVRRSACCASMTPVTSAGRGSRDVSRPVVTGTMPHSPVWPFRCTCRSAAGTALSAVRRGCSGRDPSVRRLPDRSGAHSSASRPGRYHARQRVLSLVETIGRRHEAQRADRRGDRVCAQKCLAIPRSGQRRQRLPAALDPGSTQGQRGPPARSRLLG